MKKLALLLTLTAFATGSFCQADTTSVSYVAYWSVGDTYDYNVRKTSMQWTGDSLTKDDISEYTASFEVIDSTESSYRIRWTYSNALFDTWDIPAGMLEELSKYALSEIIYTTNELGEFTGIENWQELGEMMSSMFSDVFRILSEDSGEEYEKLMQAAQPIIDMYSSKEGVEQLAFPELMLFHFPFGAMITVADTIRYEDLFPNLLGGDPIRADAKLWFEEVDFNEERSVLVQESKLNRDDTMVFLKDIMTRMGATGENFDRALSEAVYSIDTFNRYDFYYYPGVPVKIDFNRHIRIDVAGENSRREDTITIGLR
ncbi:MAG: hypothetical protein RBS37_13710 [Bacteroidales bacterium]|jgi:hypothetical protein|nr:hypothetical protein [Bacteroidales bacterium]